MNDVDTDGLTTLLDECRAELAAAVDELERSRAAHRAVESLLLAVLEHVPAPIAVLDGDGRVRAASAAAEAAWGATVGDLAAGVTALAGAGVPDACRLAAEQGHVPAGAAPDGLRLAVLDEPGTGIRYVAVWASTPTG